MVKNLIMNPSRFTDMASLQLPSSLILVLYALHFLVQWSHYNVFALSVRILDQTAMALS